MFVILYPPVFYLHSGVRKRQKQVRLQTFVPVAPIDRLDQIIIGWLSRPGKLEFYTLLVRPNAEIF